MSHAPRSRPIAAAVLIAVVVACFGIGSLVSPGSPGLGGALRAGRASLTLAFAVLLVSVPLGALLGALAARRSLADALLARAIEVCGVLPTVIAIAVLSRTEAPWLASALALCAFRALEVARLVRGELLRLSAEPFLLGARALGLNRRELLVRHALPHLADSLKLSAALTTAHVVGIEAALGFLSLSGAISWGALLGGNLDGTAYVALGLVLITTAASYWLAESTRLGTGDRRGPLANAAQKSRYRPDDGAEPSH